MVERRWASVEEVAERLSLSVSGVRKLVARGLIPSVHVGRSVRVDLRTLEANLDDQLRRQTGAPR